METLWIIAAAAANVAGVWVVFRMVRTAARLVRALILMLIPVLFVVAAAFYGQ